MKLINSCVYCKKPVSKNDPAVMIRSTVKGEEVMLKAHLCYKCRTTVAIPVDLAN